jgi:hypothetical protein
VINVAQVFSQLESPTEKAAKNYHSVLFFLYCKTKKFSAPLYLQVPFA